MHWRSIWDWAHDKTTVFTGSFLVILLFQCRRDQLSYFTYSDEDRVFMGIIIGMVNSNKIEGMANHMEAGGVCLAWVAENREIIAHHRFSCVNVVDLRDAFTHIIFSILSPIVDDDNNTSEKMTADVCTDVFDLMPRLWHKLRGLSSKCFYKSAKQDMMGWVIIVKRFFTPFWQ